MAFQDIEAEIKGCKICADRFAATHTGHEPRPVFHINPSARILIAGQAPGARVHESGLPFTDPSGDRLREWLGVTKDQFYNKDLFAIVPMAFCFPGYNAKGSDLPPPPVCAKTWHADLMSKLQNVKVKLLIGGYAQKWHLGVKTNVTDTVFNWRSQTPKTFPLPHPSWRNTSWLKKNPWFEKELLPELRRAVAQEL